MSTRCQVSFELNGNRYALVYKHQDGYPDTQCGMLQNLQTFFETVENETCDTRFDDPEYLAAKFVVYLAGPKLDFLGVGVSVEKHGDIAYLYTVECANFTKKGRPLVSYKYCYGSTKVVMSPFNDIPSEVKIVRFDYVNKAMDKSNRLVKVTEETDTMIKGMDLEKNEFRTFSKSTMSNLKEVTI